MIITSSYSAISQYCLNALYIIVPLKCNFIKLFSRKYWLTNFFSKQKLSEAPVTTM